MRSLVGKHVLLAALVAMLFAAAMAAQAATTEIKSEGPFGFFSQRGDGRAFFNAFFGSSNNDSSGITMGDVAGPSSQFATPRDIEARGIVYFPVSPVPAGQKITNLQMTLYRGGITENAAGTVNDNLGVLFPEGVEVYGADNGYFGTLADPFNLAQNASVDFNTGNVTNAPESEGWDFVDATLIGTAESFAIPGSGASGGDIVGLGQTYTIALNDDGIALFEALANDTGTMELRIQFANTGLTNAYIPSGHPANNDDNDGASFFSGTVTQQQGVLPNGFDARPFLTVTYTTATEPIVWPLTTDLLNDNQLAADEEPGASTNFNVALVPVNGTNSTVSLTAPDIDVAFTGDLGASGPAVTVAPADAPSIKTSNQYLVVHAILNVPQTALDDSTTSDGIAMTLEFESDADPGVTHTLGLPVAASQTGNAVRLVWDLTTGQQVGTGAENPASSAGEAGAGAFWTGELADISLNIFGSGELAGTTGWNGLTSEILLIGFTTRQNAFPLDVDAVSYWIIYE